MPRASGPIAVELRGPDGATSVLTATELDAVGRREQTSDFHCVSAWSLRGKRWRGAPFSAVYEQVLVPALDPERQATHARFVATDTYADSLPLEDLLADDVLLADGLDGEPLPMIYGAPLRLIVPAHYGYKNVKHLGRIALLADVRAPRGWRLKYPRGRVAEEERFGIPRVPRLGDVYRPLIPVYERVYRWADRRSGRVP